MTNWFARQLGTQQPAPRAAQPPAAAPQHISPDGKWKWNGNEWEPNRPDTPLMPPPPPEDLPRQAMQAKITQGSATCPRCHIDDTFFAQGGKKGRRCFSCGYNEIETAAMSAPSWDPGGSTSNDPARPARGQSGGGWSGAKNTTPPPQTREYT